MKTKLVAALCSLVPFGAALGVTPTEITDSPYNGNGSPNLDGSGASYYINGDFVAAGLHVNGNVNLTGGLVLGEETENVPDDGDEGYLYITEGFFSNNENKFTLTADGDVLLGSVTWKNGNAYALSLVGGGSNSLTITNALAPSGALSMSNFGSITLNSVTTSSDFSVGNSGTFTSAGLTLKGKIAQISVTGALTTTGSISYENETETGDAFTLSAGSMDITGSVQNTSNANFTMTATGDIKVSGSIQNQATNGATASVEPNMNISAVNITAAAITQSSQYSSMVVNATGNLTLNGTENNGASLVVNGDALIAVSGKTTITNGWTLGTGNSFSLTTGQISFVNASDSLTSMFTNSWDMFSLNVTNGTLDIADATITNNAGTMTILANGNITAGGMMANAGTINLTSSAGDVEIGPVQVASGATSVIAAKNVLTVKSNGGANAVTNDGNLTLNAAEIDITGSVVNNAGGVLLISDYASNTMADITITGDVVNSGTLTVNASSMDITGTLTSNTGGVANISGLNTNASITIGQILVNGGTLTFNSIGGGVTVDTAIVVRDGVLNFSGNTSQVTVNGVASDTSTSADGNAVYVAGDVTVGPDAVSSGGDINISRVGGFTLTATNGAIAIEGNLSATDTVTARRATFVADDISVGGSIVASGQGWLTLSGGNGSLLTIGDALDVSSNGRVDIVSAATTASTVNVNTGKLVLSGSSLTANSISLVGAFNGVADGLYFDGSTAADHNTGVIITGTNAFTITTNTAAGLSVAGDMSVGATGASYTLTIDSENINIAGDATVTGTLNQGSATISSGGMNLTHDNSKFTANTLTVNGNFNATGNNVSYVINKNGTLVSAKDNSGTYTGDVIMNITGTITVSNGATVSIDAANGYIAAGSLNNTGIINLDSLGLKISDSFTAGNVYQNVTATSAAAGDVNIVNDSFNIFAANVNVKSINATDLNFIAYSASKLLNIDVSGNVSGGVRFMGLESMHVGGNWTFDNGSSLNAWIKNKSTGANYWSSVDDDINSDDYGQITNQSNGGALIQVDGVFVSDFTLNPSAPAGSALGDAQFGITITDIIDQGDAIWLVHADGIQTGGDSDPLLELQEKLRNLYVRFCNYNGTICYDYFDSFNLTMSADSDDWPAYVSVRDTDGDGIADSIYIVFDPDFGGPVEVFKIQPIVDNEADRTDGEYAAAGALDDLIEGKLLDTGFFNRTPIEVIPLIFRNTNMETLMSELYDRMEDYLLDYDGSALARFSRLVQPREIEQLAGSIIMNEHTTFRDFEDHMFDEFIWNRNRRLRKAWLDFDYGMFYQHTTDGKHADGQRFSLFGGLDWQESDTLILGAAVRVSRMSGDNSDTIDLSYKPDTVVDGNVNVTVRDTDIGLGAYLIKRLGLKSSVYGNAFLDLHLLDVSRDMTFMSAIDGTGTAFSIISEWGLMHDILNQYIVGNLYGRIGYNSGFSVTEKAEGQNYMKLESDGYMILTPGYSLTAQKRIYPSAWLQLRPYASIGVEYDLLGAPDTVRYKFAPARRYTDYDLQLDPLWANIGGGLEVLSATGFQVGLDYRYQYNQDMQLHNIKLSGSYRF